MENNSTIGYQNLITQYDDIQTRNIFQIRMYVDRIYVQKLFSELLVFIQISLRKNTHFNIWKFLSSDKIHYFEFCVPVVA